MSILEQVLLGVIDGLNVDVTDDDLNVLRQIVKPDEIDSREDSAKLLVEGIGYDPETYWNRREIINIYEAGSENVDDADASAPSDAVVDAALERYEQLRSALLSTAVWNKEILIKPYAEPAFSEELDEDAGLVSDEDDSSVSSLTEEARRESDDDDEDEPPEVITEDDEDEWGDSDDDES